MNEELDENAVLTRALEVVDQAATLSTSSASSLSSSFVISSNKEEVEDREEVNQGEILAPAVVVAFVPAIVTTVLVVKLNLETVNDLSFLLILPTFREEVDHSIIEGGSVDTS